MGHGLTPDAAAGPRAAARRDWAGGRAAGGRTRERGEGGRHPDPARSPRAPVHQRGPGGLFGRGVARLGRAPGNSHGAGPPAHGPAWARTTGRATCGRACSPGSGPGRRPDLLSGRTATNAPWRRGRPWPMGCCRGWPRHARAAPQTGGPLEPVKVLGGRADEARPSARWRAAWAEIRRSSPTSTARSTRPWSSVLFGGDGRTPPGKVGHPEPAGRHRHRASMARSSR